MSDEQSPETTEAEIQKLMRELKAETAPVTDGVNEWIYILFGLGMVLVTGLAVWAIWSW